MNESGTITLKIVAQDLASGNIGKAIAGIDKLAKQGGLVGSVMQGVGQSFGQMLNPVALVGKGIGMVTDFMGDSISAASDQAEALSKVTVVFGDQADEIEAWAETAAESMGMSETAALSAAGTLGNLFDALGLTDDASADMSKSITQLAADLGSFNNVSTDEALTALQSGLLGEAEPMRRFGSNLSAARVEAYALANGMAATKGSITEAVKVQARYKLMLEDTVNAQGDFARTSDGLANSQKTLDAQMADLTTTVGQFLQGPAQGFVGFLSGIVDVVNGTEGVSASLRDVSKRIYEIHTAAASGGSETPLARLNKELQAWNDTLTGQEFTGTPESFAWLERLGPDTLRNFGPASAELVADVRSIAQAFIDTQGYTEESFRAFAASIRTQVAPAFNILTSAWTGLGETAEDTVPKITSVARAVKRTTSQMNRTMDEAKEPWRAAWRNMAAWAKNPFRPNAFENWMEKRADRAVQKAKQAARNGKPGVAANWLALAAVMKNPVLAALAETEAEIQALVAAMRTVTLLGTTTGTTRMGSKEKVAGRASGGPVSAGQTYVVGEDGPEVLRMGSGNGNIIPNHALGGGGGVTVIFNGMLTAPSEAQLQPIMRTLVPAIQREMRRAGA
jgi:hypothetical protein